MNLTLLIGTCPRRTVKLQSLIERELGDIDVANALRQLQIIARDFLTNESIPLHEEVFAYWVEGQVGLVRSGNQVEFEEAYHSDWSVPDQEQWQRYCHDAIFERLKNFRVNPLQARRSKKKRVKGGNKWNRRRRQRDRRATKCALRRAVAAR